MRLGVRLLSYIRGTKRSANVLMPTSTMSMTQAATAAQQIQEPNNIVDTQMKKKSKAFLFWFSNEHYNFIQAELEALFSLFRIETSALERKQTFGPFVILDFPNEEPVKLLMSRSVLVRSCYEIWSKGESMEELHANFKNNLEVTLPFSQTSFRVRVEAYGSTISQPSKIDLIESFDYIPMDGKIDLKNAECSLHLIQYFGLDSNNIPENPYQVFFGRWIADGQRNLITKISLKTRKFIGNTSMDPLLSLLMANLGRVKQDSLVLDPFVGTGSLLVAAALTGGYVYGTDIDYLMLHGKTRPTRAYVKTRSEDESIRANLKQYGVEKRYMDVLVADASLSLWKPGFKFDVILTDPPYGVREPTERIGSLKSYIIKEEHLDRHYPCKIDYSLCDIFSDLIDFSAERLNMGGRLVCWIPVSRTSYDEENLPRNPSFKLMANCEQALTAYAGRRVLVYEKIAEPGKLKQTVMDGSAPMYKFSFFNAEQTTTRSERKAQAASTFGKSTKRGQLVPNC